jgi:hypothetical protein
MMMMDHYFRILVEEEKNWWKGNPTSGDYNLQEYASISNAILSKAWLNGFRLTQEKAYYVEMKDVLSITITYGNWTKP